MRARTKRNRRGGGEENYPKHGAPDENYERQCRIHGKCCQSSCGTSLPARMSKKAGRHTLRIIYPPTHTHTADISVLSFGIIYRTDLESSSTFPISFMVTTTLVSSCRQSSDPSKLRVPVHLLDFLLLPTCLLRR